MLWCREWRVEGHTIIITLGAVKDSGSFSVCADELHDCVISYAQEHSCNNVVIAGREDQWRLLGDERTLVVDLLAHGLRVQHQQRHDVLMWGGVVQSLDAQGRKEVWRRVSAGSEPLTVDAACSICKKS